ncbi:GNAT family N-acetyltransferase [Rhodococcus hoagii]|jgi:phosphinothricin acetyltransferase|uniref:GNAT acetyltransferase n=1 Tax=Rhodococcus hoagii (strain 103S) TaxID=685727 RepID=A0A3S5Y497_RHOH1|nr:GNAT family N-acetyltransferase [Prescottella equi]MBM4470210.1 GNAT family N-acetyltransferase [Prescottella equi]MBM4521779.1 GNAT family N-acetyltransferase [Prescottella equi]MBM4528438.1 GNAT family N-acetyltransferase [Prescottella equi]MBM4535714.1 GNAT family N-acetyltransferase [Prescottella equi]MBM4545864.1 GNAT family N-acetyltransferase [Prescottella equi]
MLIRDATTGDLPGILEIHNEAIANTTAIWDETLADLDERRRWLDDRRADGFPVLVADVDGAVAGYASYGVWRAKSGYRYTVENSVYVHVDHHRRGIATALMTALIERARAGGIHVIVASVESSNTTSIALHERFGFRIVAQMPEVGRKFGRWLDMTYLQLTL